MSFFTIIGCQRWHLDRLTSRSRESDLGVEELIESFVFLFHVIIDLQMYMDKIPDLLLEYTREEMLDGLYIFPMHTDQECTIGSLNPDIDIVSYGISCECRDRDTESCEKCTDESEG